MTWTKTSDDFPDRFLERSDAAYRLHHAATTYCNRLGLDGRLPKARMRLVPVPSRTRRGTVVDELIAAGWWADDDTAWVLLDFFEFQLSAEEVAAQRHYDAVRQRIRFAGSPEAKAALRESEAVAKRDRNAARERRRAISHRDSHRDSQRPAPTRPVPSRPARVEDEDHIAMPTPVADGSVGIAQSEPYPMCAICGQPILGQSQYVPSLEAEAHRECFRRSRRSAA